MRKHLIVALTLAALGVARGTPTSTIRVKPISFDQLAGRADLIVLARVEEVATGPGEGDVATATVLETWKGSTDGSVRFLASPTWTCDISRAIAGETALLFLEAGKPGMWRRLLHSGRGRMPVLTEGSIKVAEVLTSDILLPDSARTVAGAQLERDLTPVQSVRLDDLKSLTRDVVDRHLNLDDLLERSDSVVVATVDEIEGLDQPSIVWLRVAELWRGKLEGERVCIRVAFSWPLDEIPFEREQKQVLLLSVADSDGCRSIVHEGRGRMTVQRVGDQFLGVAWVKDVTWPMELRADERPDREGLLFGRVDLAGLKAAVQAKATRVH